MGYIRVGVAAVVLTVLALAQIAAVVTFPIPPSLSQAALPEFVGSAARARPTASFRLPAHPYLARNGASGMHNDAYATDAYAWAGPLGRRPVVTSATYGVEECATLAFDRRGRIVALCGNLAGPVLRLLDPVSLATLARHRLPGRQFRAGAAPWEDLCGGAYFYLDVADRAVVATTDRRILVIGQSRSGFALRRAYDVSGAVPAEDCLIALLPDWAGRIWYVTSGGRVGVVDPGTGVVRQRRLPSETIANSFAADETGGVYVVSDHALYRFEADPATGTPAVSWRAAYDRGARRKPGQLSQGSGTTPTLLGGDRVAITDNAEPRMRVLVYQRSTGRLLCAEPVFGAGASATENSLIAVGDALIVENNYGYTGPGTTMFGGTTAPGVARVDVAGGRCRTAWTSAERAPTSVPKASLATGLIYVHTKPRDLDGGWFTAIDLRTGRTRWRVLTGAGPQWNNHYAAVTLGPGGAAYLATLAGMVRIQDTG